MQRYPQRMQQGDAWFIRMVVPPDVRFPVGKSIIIIKAATHERDVHRAATVAALIIAGIKMAIRDARAKLKSPTKV